MINVENTTGAVKKKTHVMHVATTNAPANAWVEGYRSFWTTSLDNLKRRLEKH